MGWFVLHCVVSFIQIEMNRLITWRQFDVFKVRLIGNELTILVDTEVSNDVRFRDFFTSTIAVEIAEIRSKIGIESGRHSSC